MKRGAIVVIVVLAAVVLLFAFSSVIPLTGNPVSEDELFFECADTDDGDDKYVKGTVTKTNRNTGSTTDFTDFCVNPNLLNEYDCENGLVVRSYDRYCDCLEGQGVCAVGT
jgi:hypothetical protein